MTLNEYMASDDSNAFWRLSSGDHQNLLDEAVERMMDAREALVAVLCDPEGNVCIQGRDADRVVVRKALDTLSVANDQKAAAAVLQEANNTSNKTV